MFHEIVDTEPWTHTYVNVSFVINLPFCWGWTSFRVAIQTQKLDFIDILVCIDLVPCVVPDNYIVGPPHKDDLGDFGTSECSMF